MADGMRPQPPPDVPAPPPCEAALISRRKMAWVMGVGISAVLFVAIAPAFIRQRRGHHGSSETVNNARQIGLALYEFETEYGSNPDASTVAAVKLATGSMLSLSGRSSNDLFAQLFASGIAQSEGMFYAEFRGSRRPDNVFHSDATILEHGECGFAYIAGLKSTDDPSTPIVFGPVIPGTKKLDRKSCEGKATILKLDNSVTTLSIDSSGKIIYLGRDLLDPAHPIWAGRPTDVKWPK